MTVAYEDVTPSLIENTTMRKRFYDGVHKQYTINPVDGYAIHDKNADWTDIDPDTMEETYKLGFKSGTVTAPANYDFTVNPRELYAVPADSVPADQIFGGVTTNPDHELM